MKLQMNEEYTLEQTNFDEFKKQVDKINSKCPNLFSIKIIDSFLSEQSNGTFKFIKFSIDNYLQNINKFQVVARKQLASSSPIIDSFDDSIQIPDFFLSDNMNCQHCHSKRNRKKVFLLLDHEDNSFIQIGSSCLKDFTGKSITNFLFFEKSVDSLNEVISSPRFEYTPFFKVSHILAQAIRLAQNGHTYLSNQSASEINEFAEQPVISTPNLIFQSLSNTSSLKPFSPEELKTSSNIISWFIQNNKNTNQLFIKNALNILINEDLIPFNFISRIAFVSFSYFRLHWIPKSSFFFPGKHGDRISQQVRLIHKSRKFASSQSSDNVTYTFINSKNNVFVWFSNHPVPELDNLSSNTFITLHGTINKFSSFNSLNQTLLSDCSVSS